MANDFSARPWTINTTFSSVSLGTIQASMVFVKFIQVVGGTAGTLGATMASVTDRNGKQIINSLYQTTNAGELQTYNLENWFEGILVPSLGSGVVLQVHIK